jgi:hypothetical protein
MSWRKITMKFPGKCVVCNEKIEENEVGLWAQGLGVKHEKCAAIKELKCSICGGPAGCPQCEYRDDCDLATVSQLCICKKCSGLQDSFIHYQNSIKKKFPLLNVKI